MAAEQANGKYETEVTEGELVAEVEVPHVLLQQTRGEIDIQIATARAYPRSIRTFLDEAVEMATLDEDMASECMYALKRGKGKDQKKIEGPSARLAEICMSAWGHCRGAARVVSIDEKFVTAQGAFFDLQRNVAITYEVRRRITNSEGRRYGDDMIAVTSNAACSIALRNAVFKGIPKGFWKRVYDQARKTAIGDATTLVERRAKMIAYFQKMGVAEQQILGLLEVKGVEDIGLDELATLKGIATSIKDGDTTIDLAFAKSDAADDKTDAVNEKLRKRREEAEKKGANSSQATDGAASTSAETRGEKPAGAAAAPAKSKASEKHVTELPSADEEEAILNGTANK